MKTLFLILCSFIIQTTYGQNNSIQKNIISGTIIDSLTNDSIIFATISTENQIRAISDIGGQFSLNISPDTIAKLTVTAINFEKRTLTKSANNTPITIKLKPIPYDVEKEFIITGEPLDTVFYKNKKIAQSGNDEITFYENGQIKSKTVNGSFREWHGNGKLKSQSILKFEHYRTETEWYDNGQMKAQGSKYWGTDQKTHSGAWFNNKDWKYWDRNGNVVNK
jgi:hypothetical protein